MHADNHVEGGQPAVEHVELAVETFRMLADVTRVQMLWALRERELSVNELASVVGKPAASMSQHLAKMRLARLVSTRREGTKVFYRLDNSHVRQLVEDAVFNAEHAGAEVPAHHRGGTGVAELSAARDGRIR
jgi:DNA-binding transcriptional ArsR family regulator